MSHASTEGGVRKIKNWPLSLKYTSFKQAAQLFASHFQDVGFQLCAVGI